MQNYQVLNIVHPKLTAKLGEFRLRQSVANAGFATLTDWHPTIPTGWGQFPQVDFARAVIYREGAQKWSYSHHQAITRFGNKYVASWSNGFLHEDYAGQEVHWAWSADGIEWSEPQVIVHTPIESGLIRNNVGLYVCDDRLYCYVGVAEDFRRDVTPPNLCSLNEPRIHLDVYETNDLDNWKHHKRICDYVYLFEAPRRTSGGKLLCCGME